MMKNLKWLIIVGTLSLVFCNTLWAKDKFPYSGFLPHYPNVQPDPNYKGAYIWSAPGFNLAQVDKILLAPLEVWVSPDSEYKGLTADQIQVLSGAYRRIIIEIMDPDYPLVSKVGSGVIYIRMGLTNVKLNKKREGFFYYLPPGLIVGGISSLTERLRNISLKEAVLEMEAIEYKTGKQVAVRIMPIGGRAEEYASSFDDVEKFMRYRIKQVRAGLDKAHKK